MSASADTIEPKETKVKWLENLRKRRVEHVVITPTRADLMDALGEARNDAMDKEELIDQLQSNLREQRSRVLELQLQVNYLTGDSAAIGIKEFYKLTKQFLRLKIKDATAFHPSRRPKTAKYDC